MLRNILWTLVSYIVDILIFGSALGLLFVLTSGLTNWLAGSDYNLWHSFLKGVIWYWVFDSIAAKFREEYNNIKEYL